MPRNMDQRDYRAAARQIVETCGLEAARELLRLLDSDDVVRADLFRQLHERGTHEPLLDALTDLEVDPLMRGWLAEALRLRLGAV
jgi:hypothetical protein